ncbi:hypothetical protein A2W54_03355 [Candidatus Giovannonibacteria bacterium RIFCSPHIGHO2_02_43_13]|uniref:Uncharacterized protein n=1 Tax=Candidatus Giovannonibacteria bacterium RIFCSPHIGHO2_02_43_13 TaxID=1798330 RepID=A0A1F5WQ88_9BACT|nr:MAG: hypothetical protein UW28_C0004G0016 [Parcubacteria group bacterium GW2011_GWA2_44_13]OGF73924.1 MAG: hypothetical protein A3E06_00565 [Candidatus Giovannonibacteria bacterium RIFCSPHIGHO2_12_FULL_44_42]OGF77815.1 MAG: hypothetical protein A2W54_03355 [Candidatus Giovannonibacteria bacterium RIFCSPHIGHO2_02_43_13]OGF88850.1 MAG: hypothetical protein A3I94_02500 [Candidatus Giovannonibacteria bacterium RIFCSPLOWO2_02_FULL_43_54]OGF96814.1 MAG: hypothetical protein A3H08_01390 [Candidatus
MLLAENYKKLVRREKILRLSAYFFFMLSAAGILGLALMLPSYFLLIFSKDDHLRTLRIEEEILARKELGKLEGEISKVNEAIDAFERNEKKRRSISGVLIRLFRTTPSAGIRIFSLNLKREKTGEFLLAIQGSADRREDFLKYKAALEASPDFSGVISPIKNLLSEFNLEFNIELKIKPEIYGI